VEAFHQKHGERERSLTGNISRVAVGRRLPGGFSFRYPIPA
jgi:hypothetical protein